MVEKSETNTVLFECIGLFHKSKHPLDLQSHPSIMIIEMTDNSVAGVPTTIDYHKLILDIEVNIFH